MKPSLYNFNIRIGDKKLIFNAKTGHVIPYSPEDLIMVSDIFRNAAHSSLKNSAMSDLSRLGYLVKEDAVESFPLVEDRRHFLQSNKHICITVVVTGDCNFRCLYCYQTHNKKTLKIQNIDRIKKFIGSMVKNKDTVTVLYFGGEPLLNPDAIEEIHRYVFGLSKYYGVDYHPKISTNGYLIDKEIFLFRSIDFDMIRITLDGSEETHDKLRKTSDGKETFRTIADNILLIQSPRVVIRVNISPNSFASFEKLCRFLRDMDFKGSISIDVIESNCMESLCSGKQFKDYVSYVAAAVKYNLRVTWPLVNRTVHCLFEVKDSYLVTPDASVYKCFVSDATYMGKIRADGEIHRNGKAQTNAAKWESLLDVSRQCSRCKVFPFCAGGCRVKNLMGKKYCPQWKNHISKLIATKVGHINFQRGK